VKDRSGDVNIYERERSGDENVCEREQSGGVYIYELSQLEQPEDQKSVMRMWLLTTGSVIHGPQAADQERTGGQ